MKILDHGCRRSHRVSGERPVLVWDPALSARFERLYDEMIDREVRVRRRGRLRRAFDDE